jgi:co-chaperonin GroES (HSP10)
MNPTPTPAAPTLPETGMRCRIQPLGEQIIIRTIPQNSIGSILVPDSAKGITMTGEKGAEDAVHFVEAEVVAVGPGKRQKGDAKLLEDLWDTLYNLYMQGHKNSNIHDQDITLLKKRYNQQNGRLSPLVKPGDRILYHPAVQKFDRDITDVMQNGNEVSGSKYFMIREESVLAVIERT